MNLIVTKYVAGAGKTTNSKRYLRENPNGMYLAFNNKVVDKITNSGYLAKTIDSLFVSFILPKLIKLIPIIKSVKKITYVSPDTLPNYLKGVSNIHIRENGDIFNCSKKTTYSLYDDVDVLYKQSRGPNIQFLRYIFNKDELKLTDVLRNDLSLFLVKKYPEYIGKIISTRFSYLIIDEAQDLKLYQEEFAKLMINYLPVHLYGDDNQNINGGGTWFESLNAENTVKISRRCPENNCKWIRENLKIDIYGCADKNGELILITNSEIEKFNDGLCTLLYSRRNQSINKYIDCWKGPKYTIKKAKGMTIYGNVLIIGKTLNVKNMYTAITRSTDSVFLIPRLKK